ncbi:MAG: dephospho-CoA kinase [Bacteroidota bacterium]
MMKIGITGGIGSGKTTVCKIFETLGIPVYYADDRAKQLMIEKPALIKQIKATFGEKSYDDQGQLNRTYLAQIVFSDPPKLKQLNQLVHPVVFEDTEQWHQAQKNTAYTLKEAALLFESGSFRTLDAVIAVYAPQKERIKRVMQRDQVNEDQVLARMEKQMSDLQKIQLSDYVITNNQRVSLVQQVLTIHQNIIQQLK